MPIPSKILNYTPATGDSGRRRQYTNQDPADLVNTGFRNHEAALDRDTVTDTSLFSVGGSQSTLNKEGGCLKALTHLGLYKQAYKLEDRIKFRDLDISIENKKGSVREWFNPHNNTHGKTKMTWPYGYIRMTEGMDGDHVDCFIGPNENAPSVYVISTNKAPSFKHIDEQKCMLGFDSAEDAKRAFLDNYNNPKFFREMKEMSYEEFRQKALATRNSNRHKIGFYDFPKETSIGTPNDKVPGDYLGLPRTSLVGLRTVKGDPLSPRDKLHHMFRYMDTETNTDTLDGNTDALPSDPAV